MPNAPDDHSCPAGNHALALAYHGKALGIPVTVVMPTIAPITKVQNCKDLGATVHLQGAWRWVCACVCFCTFQS